MKLIDYSKYAKKWSPRSAILLAVWEALFTGFMLGIALFEAINGKGIAVWLFWLALGISAGVGALQAVLVALHQCSPSRAARDDYIADR